MPVSADDMSSVQEDSMDLETSTLPHQRPTTLPSTADQIQPNPISPTSANPITATNEQHLDNAGAEQPVVQMTAGSSMSNDEQPVDDDGDDDYKIDFDALLDESLSGESFSDEFFSANFFLQYNPLLAMEATDPNLNANQMPTNLVTNQPTINHSPPALQYPPGGIWPTESTRGGNNNAFFNQTMQQVSHERHPFEGDGDWDEFINTAKGANNWGPDDPHLEDL